MNWSRFRVILPGVAILLVSALAAGPAYADPPGSGPTTSSGGCSGQNCFTGLLGRISLTGSEPGVVSQTAVNTVSIAPPLCWMQPWMDGQDTYNWWIHQSVDTLAEGGPSYLKFEPQIDQEKNAGPDQGMWWAPQQNSSEALIADNSSYCQSLPVLEWVPTGQAPQEIAQTLPPKVLAQYAYAHMIIPSPSFTLSPATKTEVNLPTFITNLSNLHPLSVTASIFNGAESVTVTATPGKPVVSVQSGAGTAHSDCGPNGTRETNVNSVGVGQVPDCGVVFSQPSPSGTQGYGVTVTDNWTVTWTGGQLGPPVVPPTTINIPVVEIQSVNGG